MKLIGTTHGPFVREVRAVFAEKNFHFYFVAAHGVPTGSTVIPFNSLWKLLCLVIDEGRCLYDSKVITKYLESTDDDPSLIPSINVRKRIIVRYWEAQANGVANAGASALETQPASP